VAGKNHYELLEVPPTASFDEVKRAFRQQIARYHPDKVQHLGKEFQALAAERAADLTEAYRILSDAALREEYDQSRRNPAPPSPAGASKPWYEDTGPQPIPPEWKTASDPAPQAAPDPAAGPEGAARTAPRQRSAQFSEERESRDAFVKKATLDRVRRALAATFGSFEEKAVRGFDLACVPKAKRFSRRRPPTLLVSMVARVDAAAVAEAWAHGVSWNAPPSEEICVLLMGSSVDSPRALSDAIHAQRRKPTNKKMTIIPIDTRDWHAHIPIDAPGAAKTVLEHLRARG
jgi:curved DNA-binding protein CbpA